MPFISYAQNYEDVLLWRALHRVGAGFYIDIGALHPDENSASRAFHDRGWTGVNIQTAPAAFALLAAGRPRDVNLGGTVGAAPGALADICRAHAPADIHFLRIASGDARDVLKGADFTRYRPWIVLVEALAPGTRVPTEGDWEDALLAADYRFAWFDGLNRFYLAAERDAALRPHFTTPPNVFDDFIRPAEAVLARRMADMQGVLAASEAEAGFAALRVQFSDARVRDAVHARGDLRALMERIRADVLWRKELQEEAEAAAQALREEVVWRRDLLAQSETIVETLRKEIAWLRDVKAEKERDGKHLTEAAQAAQTRAAAADAALAAFQASRAWRLTAPLRRLAGTVRRR